MVGARWQTAPGIRLDASALLALRDAAPSERQRRPATRRAGVAPSRQAGSGIDLREIRAYVPGDDPRRLDPSATARTGTPHVRALHEDRDDVTILIADFRAPMLWGTGAALRSGRGAAHLAEAGWQAVARGGAVGLIVAGADGPRSLAAVAGEAQMAVLCAMLADRHAQALDLAPDTGPLAPALALAHRLAPQGAHVLLATAPGAWEGEDAPIARLARGRRLEVALILDELEVAPPARALPVRCAGRSGLARLSPLDTAPLLARLSALGARPRTVAP